MHPILIGCSEVGAVLLVGVSISRGYSDKKQLQRLAEWCGLEGVIDIYCHKSIAK